MSNKKNGKENPQSAKVLKLGFNISVSGDPGSDFEIVLDDKEKTDLQSSSQDEEQLKPLDALEAGPKTNLPKNEIEKVNSQEVQSKGAIPKSKKSLKNSNSSESLKSNELEMDDNSVSKDTSIIRKLKSTMEQFEKFSDHIKEIPRLRNCPIATSTPFSDKYNSKSESNLVYPEFKPKKYSQLYEFQSRKEYFRGYGKPSPPDLFLKPLPAEGYYKRGIYTRYIDLEPYRHYGSDNALNNVSEYKNTYVKSSYDFDKYDDSYTPPEPLSGILKKSDSESGDKQSTSSADSIKDIKIYQSGGILIMQNFKDNMDATEKKEISDFSAKLIENCNKLKMEISNFQEDKPAIGYSSDENKNFGKMVQFDLSSVEGQKSKSGDSSSNALKDESSGKMESSESTSDVMKKDASPPGTSQSQDFPSLSTQENDSILSNQPGMSPTCTTSKKLEWDSGADIGYLNLDLTKENLSTIEKIVLKGLSSDGMSEKNVVYEKSQKSDQNQTNRSKFILERKASDMAMEEIMGRSVIKSKDINPSDRGFVDKKNEKGESETEKEENPRGIFKDENRSKLEEIKFTGTKNSSKEVSPANRIEILPAEKLETSDKSVNVNTLFQNASQQTPIIQAPSKESIRFSESPIKPKQSKHRKPPKVNLSRSKKPPSQRVKTPKKSVSAAGANLFSGNFEMGVPKKVYKKVEANPTINDIELSREVDEIIIDQRFKIKTGKEAEVPQPEESTKEVKSKNRPISASSSSNNTVLPKSEKKEDVEEKTKTSEQRLTDQIIQTSDYDCQSVGVQAFASQVSSDCEYKSFRKTGTTKPNNKESVNTSSKNIQAFGLNASLPKQLEHPKETEIFDRQHTKSTQFFGGPLNSLPNYHSNLVTKPGESCGRAPNILKTKKATETEIIRLKEENERNTLANDAPKLAELKRDSRRHDNENKENIISQKSTNSKRSQSNASRKDSKGNDSGKKDQTKGKKNSLSEKNSECLHTSDEVSSMVLTSEVLREHGDCIDRNIIQEKYFQSQLVELEKRKMISRSTSMEIQLQLDENVKEYMTTGCQYSPQSRGTTSEGQYQEPDDSSLKDDPSRRSQLETSKDTNREQNPAGGDSLPSSTQTAHSWIPGMQNAHENTTGVGRARSFEYLPGHIYESSGNLREELPSETEQNIITSCSDSETAKGSASESRDKDSEGRNTLILENSSHNSHDSDRLKILDENLAQLNFAVLKLREKDTQVQSVTKSLLANLWKKMGSGDSLVLGAADTSKSEPRRNKDSPDYEKEANNTLSEISTQELKKDTKEFSIACQTELKSQSSDSENFSERRKVLEKRISKEKRCQIKWIENEIHHLNILREILEQQNNSVQRKKKHSLLTMALNNDKSEETHVKNTPKEICPRTVTPVYGCTISISDKSNTASEKNNPPVRERECQPQYGMTVSLAGNSNNWQHLVTFPVDLQVSLKDINIMKDCNNSVENNTRPCSHRKHSSKLDEQTVSRPRQLHSDMCTQYPSPKGVSISVPISSQAEIPSPRKSCPCSQDNCLHINLSGNSSVSVSRSARSKSIDERHLSESHFQYEESDPEKKKKSFSSISPETLAEEYYPDCNTRNRRKSTDERLNSPESYKCKSSQSANCKCRSAPYQLTPKFRSASGSCGSCLKNIFVQDSKSNSPKQLLASIGKCTVTTSRGTSQPNVRSEKTNDSCCSKIQLHKSSHCSCHSIKIHGSRCCSSERKCCPCHKASKKTENQSCQTNCEAAQQTEEEPSKRDCRTSVKEKSPSDTKEELRPKSAPNCNCKSKPDEHPRHYFLRFEEKEVEELNKPTEPKKSLEVITVTIPVKKAGKGKIYDTDIRQTRDPCNSSPKLSLCKCGKHTNYQTPKNYKQDYSSGYSRSGEEKPEPPCRSPEISKSYESNGYEDFCSEVQPFSSAQQYYQNDFEHEVTRPVRDGCCETCNCVHRRGRENQNEYNSHQRRKSIKENYDDGTRFCQDIREDGQREMSKNCRPQYSAESVNPEYFNYNKREFMTKSEIKKEEEQKRKVHQPSLQEYLASNRPDFYNNAEKRREIISERSKERLRRNRMECLLKMLNKCNEQERCSKGEPKRIFTSEQMRELTFKRYKKLPEVTEKIADRKKKEEYRTNRLMADVFAKKLQIEALKGHLNLSNSVSVLNTI